MKVSHVSSRVNLYAIVWALISLCGVLTPSANADMLVFWDFDQSYYDGSDYVIDTVASERLNLVNSSIVDGKLTAEGGYALGTAANNGLNVALPTGTSNYTLSAFLTTTKSGAVGIISWGVRNAGHKTNSFRTEKNGIDNYWWGDDLAVTGYPEVISGFENHVVATGAGRTQTLYLNGQLIGTRNANGDRSEENRFFTVGNTVNDNRETLYGSIDNASVYNEALEQSEIINIASHTYNGLSNYWKSGDRNDRVSGVVMPDTVTGTTVITGANGTMVFDRELQAGERAYYQGQLASGHDYVIDNMAGSDPAKTTWLRTTSANLSDAGQTPLGIYVGGTTTASTLTATVDQLNAVNRTLVMGGGTLAIAADADAAINANRVDFNSGSIALSGSGKITLNSDKQATFRAIALNDTSSLEIKTDSNVAVFGGVTGDGALIKTGSGDMYFPALSQNHRGTVAVNGGTLTFGTDNVFGWADRLPYNSMVFDNATVTNNAAIFNPLNNATFKNGAKVSPTNGQAVWKAFMLSGYTNIEFSGDGSVAENPVIFEVASTASGDAWTNATINPYGNTFNIADITKSDAPDLIVNAVFSDIGDTKGRKIGSFTKAGEGTMKLSAANTYTGGTTLQAGEIVAANDAALGAGGITIEGGTLTLGDSSAAAQNLTTNGALNMSGGQINFDFIHAGSAQFDNINLGSGAMNISGGVFNVNFVEGNEETWFNNAGDGYALITSNGAAFVGDLTDQLRGVSSAYGWTLMSSASGLYLYGKVDADYYKLGSATMTDDVNVGNSYGSYLGIQFDDSTAPAVSEATNTGWVMMYNMDGSFNIGEGHTLTQQGLVTGTKGLSKIGAGTLIIDRENDYQGGTAIGEGKLVLTDNGSLGTGASVVTAGTFEINNNEDREFSTVISGSGAVVKSGSGTLTLSAPNTFSGDMDIMGGTVTMAYNALAGGTDQTATVLGAPMVEGRKITVHSGATLLTANGAPGIDVFGGAEAHPKFRIVADGGTIATATDNLTTYGDIELKNGAVFEERGGHSTWFTIFNGDIYVTEGNATIQSTSAGRGISLRGYRDGTNAGVTFDVAKDSTLTVSALLRNCNNRGVASSFTKTGEGTMILSNRNNDFTGNIIVDEGTLKATSNWTGRNGNTVFGKNAAKTVTVNKGAELVFASQDVVANAGTSSPIQFIVNGGKISNSGAVFNNLSYTVFTDGAELYASDGNNPWKAYKLSMTVSVLRNADDSAADPVRFTSDLSKPNATFSFGHETSLYVEDVTASSSTEYDAKSDLIISAVVTNPNSESNRTFYKDGVGTLEFTAANTFDGNVGIREGVLRLSGDGTLGSSAVNIIDGATLEFAVASGEKRFDNTVTGNGQILKTGEGALYLFGTDANPITASSLLVEGGSLMFKGDFTGDVIIGAGTLLSAGNSVGTLNVTGDVTIDGTALFEFGAYTGADENHDVIALGADYVFNAGDNMISLYFENGDASSWAVDGAEYKLIANGGFDEGDYSSLLANYTDLFGLLGKSDGLYLIAGAGPGPGPEPGSGVPEPSTWALLILGAAGLLYWRKRK